MQSDKTVQPEGAEKVTLYISEGSIDKFVYMLQLGILLPATTDEMLGPFLLKLPDFTTDYIADEVQTIFLDGTAIDDLETVLDGEHPVVAISAAMPGLSGAIYRRNSIHAALRTTTAKTADARESSLPQPNCVTLKLFNGIAQEKGAQLLREGVTIKSSHVLDFLDTRDWLQRYIRGTRSVNNENGTPESFNALLRDSEWLHLSLREAA